MNENGHPATLVAPEPANTRALTHGLYSSRREITPEVRELADELMALPHVQETDYPAALEIAQLIRLVDRIDGALSDGRVERGGSLRALVDERRRLSKSLMEWYSAFGLTPGSRLYFAQRVAGGQLGRDIAEAVLRAGRLSKALTGWPSPREHGRAALPPR